MAKEPKTCKKCGAFYWTGKCPNSKRPDHRERVPMPKSVFEERAKRIEKENESNG